MKLVPGGRGISIGTVLLIQLVCIHGDCQMTCTRSCFATVHTSFLQDKCGNFLKTKGDQIRSDQMYFVFDWPVQLRHALLKYIYKKNTVCACHVNTVIYPSSQPSYLIYYHVYNAQVCFLSLVIRYIWLINSKLYFHLNLMLEQVVLTQNIVAMLFTK